MGHEEVSLEERNKDEVRLLVFENSYSKVYLSLMRFPQISPIYSIQVTTQQTSNL